MNLEFSSPVFSQLTDKEYPGSEKFFFLPTFISPLSCFSTHFCYWARLVMKCLCTRSEKSAENDKNKKSAKTQKHELISFFPDAHSWYSTFSKATAKNRNQWRQATLDRKTHLLLAALQESFPIKPHFTPCAREVALSSLRTSFHKMASPSYFCNGSRGQ